MIDIDSIMAELDQIREENREVANTAKSWEVYKGTRNKYLEAIVASGLDYNGKTPHLSYIGTDDITFFKRNWDKFLHVVKIIDYLSGEYAAALFETAKMQDAAMELKVISERMDKDRALGGEPYDNQFEKIVEELERAIGKRYSEIEKRYMRELGIEKEAA